MLKNKKAVIFIFIAFSANANSLYELEKNKLDIEKPLNIFQNSYSQQYPYISNNNPHHRYAYEQYSYRFMVQKLNDFIERVQHV